MMIDMFGHAINLLASATIATGTIQRIHMKTKDIQFLMNVAKLSAKQSYAERLKVGGVICDKNDDIIAYGYNGTVKGTSNICERREYSEELRHSFTPKYPNFDLITGRYFRLVTKESTLHCEINLIAHAARRGISVEGGTVVITHSPCERCTTLLIQVGIKAVYFNEKFRTYDIVIKEFGEFITLIQI